MAPLVSNQDGGARGFDRRFVTTHWSVVMAAGEFPAPQAVKALESLYCSYRYPLYAYLRRRGYGPESAEDLVQDFFQRLLEKNILSGIVQERGRFRSFLLTALSRRLADEWDREHTQKRGGGMALIPWDTDQVEQRYQSLPAGELSPERLFNRQWVTTLVENALRKLKEECVSRGKGLVFDRLSELLIGERESATYVQIGVELGMTETAVKGAVHRLRQRYRELFREEVAQTVARPDEIDAEMRAIREIVSG